MVSWRGLWGSTVGVREREGGREEDGGGGDWRAERMGLTCCDVWS